MDLELNELIGKNLKEARERRGLTVRQLEALTGVKYQQISRYEHGKTGITAETLDKFARVLGVNIAQLLGEKMKPTKKRK